MMKNTNLKLLFVLLLVFFALYKLYPTIKFYTTEQQQIKALELDNPEAFKGAIKLGLDLKGGIRLVLEIDRSKLTDNEKKDAINRALEVIRNRVDQFGVAEPSIQKQGDDRIIVEMPGFFDVERAKNLIGSTALLEFRMVREADEVGPALEALDRYRKKKRAGADTSAASQSEAAAAPAKSDTATVDSALDVFAQAGQAADSGLTEEQKTAQQMEADIFRDKPFTSLLVKAAYDIAVPKKNEAKVRAILDDPGAQQALSNSIEFAWSAELEGEPGNEFRRLYLLKKKPELTGSYLEDARASTSSGGMSAGQAVVNMELSSEGAGRFSRLTGANIDKRLAIVLDSRVYSAPVIRSKIPNGKAEITGMKDLAEARDLSIVLRAGALPAPMEIIEERTVGPTLGQDSITQSKKATVIAMLFILLFMVLYYRWSGLIAITALVLNVIYLLASLAGLGFTLTLPGIAGMILTVGMAVDANVLINERIREEMALGKTIRAAIDAGYSRAFRAIFDSNITTIITGVILYYYGTGPIKGFAVTLTIGLMISMFTAIWVTRQIFNYAVLKFNMQKLSI